MPLDDWIERDGGCFHTLTLIPESFTLENAPTLNLEVGHSINCCLRGLEVIWLPNNDQLFLDEGRSVTRNFSKRDLILMHRRPSERETGRLKSVFLLVQVTISHN